MNNFYKLLLASLFGCCIITVNAEEKIEQMQSEQKQSPTLEKYLNSEKHYSIDYPSDWVKSDVPQLDLVLFAPSKEDDGKPHASMNVVSEKVGKGITLDQFYSESATNLTSALKEVQVEKSGDSQLNGVTSKWMQYTHMMQGVKFRVLQYFVVAQETIFLITFSVSADEFDHYRADFEKIAKSFKILNQNAVSPAKPAAFPATPADQPADAIPAK